MRPRGRASKPVFATTGHQLPIRRTRFERPTTVGIGCCTCSGHKLPSWPGDFHPEHRVTGGGHPPPVPTERGVRISRTTLFGSRLQHRECLHLPVRETQFGSQQRRPLFDLVEGGPGEVFSGPAAAAQHPVPSGTKQ